MKKLIIAGMFIITGSIFSCSTPPAADSTAKADAEKNAANTKEIYKAIETGDVSKLDAIIAADGVDHGSMGDIKGLDSIKKMLGDMHTHFDKMKFEVTADATSADGSHHFSWVRMTGTTKDNSMGMPANESFDMTAVDVERIKDGKIVEHWEYDSPKDMMKMMEAQKSMAAPAADTAKKK